ncbi:hypothetical protein LIER_03684 [Lithospermum erythrorhizon]|uniref:Uncharacterized protein n=1 Tax=Lithospermum erythrorhizon TaxID=34254 RepID=A0AAV3NV69_LITER
MALLEGQHYPSLRLWPQIQGIQKKEKGCYLASTKRIKAQMDRKVCTLQVPEESPKKGKPNEDVRSVPFDEKDPVKVFKICTTLGAEHQEVHMRVLREYRDIFSWEPKDMPGVDPGVAIHRLYMDPHYKPIKQKKWTYLEEKGEAIREEVNNLLGAAAIREFLVPTFLANMVLVPKPSGTWRMCTDFTDINKACFKDCYLLPNIDLLVESSAGDKEIGAQILSSVPIIVDKAGNRGHSVVIYGGLGAFPEWCADKRRGKGNGQVELMNSEIFKVLKKQLQPEGETLERQQVPRSWNAYHPWKYYV